MSRRPSASALPDTLPAPVKRGTRPAWIRVRMPGGPAYARIKENLNRLGLHTVCEQALCPNLSECWGRGTATFLVLGDICSRSCRFCAVSKGTPPSPDAEEPGRLAKAVADLQLKYAVITSVTRDDLPDGGAGHFAAIIREVRRQNRECRIEVLIPDFKGSREDLETVIAAAPEVLGHNVETVPRLYFQVRPQASYRQSLELLERIKRVNPLQTTKSGLMVGLGETREEILEVIQDLQRQRVDMLTIGQYLQPSRSHLPVARYYSPEEFVEFGAEAQRIGFSRVESGPLVRSSYYADKTN
jgi:lipoyl synthase